jgi:hypothetical protein
VPYPPASDSGAPYPPADFNLVPQPHTSAAGGVPYPPDAYASAPNLYPEAQTYVEGNEGLADSLAKGELVIFCFTLLKIPKLVRYCNSSQIDVVTSVSDPRDFGTDPSAKITDPESA